MKARRFSLYGCALFSATLLFTSSAQAAGSFWVTDLLFKQQPAKSVHHAKFFNHP
jgi:hypothetical protein